MLLFDRSAKGSYAEDGSGSDARYDSNGRPHVEQLAAASHCEWVTKSQYGHVLPSEARTIG